MDPNQVFSGLREELECLFPGPLSAQIVAFMNIAHESLQAFGEQPESEALEDRMSSAGNRLCAEVMRTAFLSLDDREPWIQHGAHRYHRADEARARVMTSFGKIEYLRSRYRRRGCRSVFPADLKAGLIGGFWTPRAARLALYRLCSLSPRECVKEFRQHGGMCPGTSSLIRLYETAGTHWEAVADDALEEIRRQEEIPSQATHVTIQMDGVMVPMIPHRIEQKQHDGPGPGVEWKEASCAAITLNTAEGDIVRTVRHGRMPEKNKVRLKRLVVDEVEALLARRPDLRLVTVADGAKEYWRFFEEAFPEAEQVLDFFHAAEHLKSALDLAYGMDGEQARRRYNSLRETLLTDGQGIDRVIASLVYLASRHAPGVWDRIGYFRSNRRRMRYAECRSRNLTIGSGLVEATNKVLVTQRMKNSGMKWGQTGGQAILSLRALKLSDRFDAAWPILRSSMATAG